MKIDVYCVLLGSPRRFGMKASAQGIPPATFAHVPALPEMTDGQLVRQALETTIACLETLGEEAIGTQVVIHLDDPPDGFRGGYFVPKFGDGHDEELAESVSKLKSLLVSPKDLRFKRSPNGGALL